MKTQRLNILYTHSSAGLFGSDKSLFYILNYLDKERFRPLVVLPGKGPLVEKLKNAGIHVIFPPCMGIIRRFRGPAGMALYFFKLAMEIVWLIVLLKKNKISLVHVNTTSILGGMIAARVCGIPSVCHVREIRVSPKWIGKLLATMVNVFSRHCISISRAVSRFLESGWVKPGSIHLIHDGIESGSPSVDNVERLKKKLNLPSNSKVVGTVGRITRWKGVHVFIDAAREVLADCPETHFLVVGSPDTEQARKYFLGLRKKVLDQGLSERIHFTGFREDIPQLLSVMDVFILPSIFPEPFGLVTLEAMLARKPVIVTAHGGSLDIVSDQKEGYLCRPADCGELAEKIKRLLNDPALCQSMGDCGYKRATEDFEVKVQVEKIMNCYNQWLSSDSRERQKRS